MKTCVVVKHNMRTIGVGQYTEEHYREIRDSILNNYSNHYHINLQYQETSEPETRLRIQQVQQGASRSGPLIGSEKG